MFHVKHRKNAALRGVWRGSRGGLERSNTPLERAGRGLAGVCIVTPCLSLGVLLLAACSSPEEIAHDTGVAATTASARVTGPAAPPAPPTPAPDKVAFIDNTSKGSGNDAAKRDFAYNWPAAVSAIPALAQRFTAERDELLADQKNEWKASLTEFASSDCVSCVNRDFEKTWEVVADLPRFLSLSASFYEYSGGAHGNGAFEALVWDRETKAALDPKTMFRSQAVLQDALGAPWCKALKAERTDRLGAEYADDGFFPCPPISDLTVLAGSSDKQSFDRIGLIAAPYVAGSYAEGSYELTFAVTPKLLAAVKPEYKAAFALGK